MTSLESDVFVFSALKTHAQLFEASRQLLTKDGKVKSFQQFSQDIAKIEKDYNQAYLQAEYNFAVSSAQQAANWAKIEENGDRYNLQYRTAGDDKVRDSHEALDGTTLPPSDPFWNSYYPPNGWNCRCVAVEVLKDKYPESDSKKAIQKGDEATMQIGKDGKNRMEIFRFNPGKEKVVFPPNHPYRKLQGADYIKDLKYRDFVFQKPIEKQYSSIYNSSTGGKVLVHDLADIKAPRVKSDDYIDRIEAAKAFAKQGHTVRVLPVVDSKDIEIRKVVLKGYSHKTANPDFLIDGKYVDLKRPESIRRILYNANKASLKQNSIAVLTDEFIDKAISKEVLESRMNDV